MISTPINQADRSAGSRARHDQLVRQCKAGKVARPPEAVDESKLAALQQGVHERPDDAQAWFKLGCALNRVGRAHEALQAFDCALTLSPDHVDVSCERALVLLALRSFDAAGDQLEDVVATHPLHGVALLSLGNVRYQQGRLEEAALLWRRAAEVLEDPVDALENLAVAHQRLGQPDEERQIWREVLRRDPNHAAALHKLAALGGETTPLRASDGYVTHLFNAFAGEFDTTLQALGYCGPRLVATVVGRVVGEPRSTLSVLDGGCGTGGCGSWLRPLARRLVGVDLSRGMLTRAGASGWYDELVQAELSAYLREHPRAFDLIVAADTLNYFGALDEVLTALAHALRPGGHCVFTLEKRESSPEQIGYRLHPHGRYTHTADYVSSTLKRAGLTDESIACEVLRFESNRPVDAWVVAAQQKRDDPLANPMQIGAFRNSSF